MERLGRRCRLGNVGVGTVASTVATVGIWTKLSSRVKGLS
jgi:hypothetical protein